MAKRTKTNAPKRYFRSQLSTIVWDKENECELANFSQGHFTTTDERIQNILETMGYPEIPIDLESPPDIVVKEPKRVIKGDVPVFGKGVAPIVAQTQMDKLTTIEGDILKKPEVKIKLKKPEKTVKLTRLSK